MPRIHHFSYQHSRTRPFEKHRSKIIASRCCLVSSHKITIEITRIDHLKILSWFDYKTLYLHYIESAFDTTPEETCRLFLGKERIKATTRLLDNRDAQSETSTRTMFQLANLQVANLEHSRISGVSLRSEAIESFLGNKYRGIKWCCNVTSVEL